ncbi:MAG: hypothetical protein CM15mP79_0330 [Methanobacteriota archaeon]|nr:MAG: hypothetical protein CM15mP79_0330 [Euryarchaeota archaeon]
MTWFGNLHRVALSSLPCHSAGARRHGIRPCGQVPRVANTLSGRPEPQHWGWTLPHTCFVSLDYISDYYHGGATSTAGIVHYDIRSDALPYDDETVSNVYASHVIEHVESEHVERFLVEAHRVLKPGGVLRIACPDARFLYEVSSFENDYWKWRRDQFEHDERYEVQGDITQSDFLTRELAS